MEYFAEIVRGFYPFTIFVKRSILDIWQGFEYASDCSPQMSDIWYTIKRHWIFTSDDDNNSSDNEGNSSD